MEIKGKCKTRKITLSETVAILETEGIIQQRYKRPLIYYKIYTAFDKINFAKKNIIKGSILKPDVKLS